MSHLYIWKNKNFCTAKFSERLCEFLTPFRHGPHEAIDLPIIDTFFKCLGGRKR
ncbi:MAG: hypothetical protein K0S24_1531 [Sphingobacterium sp.]|jgi:hypothetical protein|nr:hypothetical protein [Sphingobacterium sp.]